MDIKKVQEIIELVGQLIDDLEGNLSDNPNYQGLKNIEDYMEYLLDDIQ